MSEPVSEASGKPPRRRPRRWLRILKRVVIALLIIVAVLVFGVFPYWFSSLVTNAGTRPMDRKLISTPADFGAPFKDVEFQTSDGVKISGWLLPSSAQGTTIVYSHGLFRSRRELLARAIVFGSGVRRLLYDARSHGERGKARVTMGTGRLDAKPPSILRRRFKQDRIVLFGISMGAAARCPLRRLLKSPR